MPKKNSLTSKEYWEKREAYKLKKGLKDLKKIEKELVDEYKKAMNEIGKEISNLFYKYAKDKNLSYSDAKKYLNSSEFREFKRDLKSYMKLIEETVIGLYPKVNDVQAEIERKDNEASKMYEDNYNNLGVEDAEEE